MKHWMYGILVATAFLSSCNGNKMKIVENVVKVKTTTAEMTSVNSNQSYSGTIEEVNGLALSFTGAGTIKSLNVSEGQMVNAGQLIGVIDATSSDNALKMAHATTIQAEETVNQAADAYRRMKILHDKGSLPEIKWVEVDSKYIQAQQALRQAQASERIARKGYTDTRLRSPFRGYVANKTAEVGQNVMPGQSVVKLVKIDKVKVKISVPEEEITKIKIKQTIQFRVSSLGNKLFSGQVTEKSVSADPISRSYEVKAVVQNPDHQLLPGMICDAYVNLTGRTSNILLPANVIQIDIDNQPFVWTVVDGKAKMTPVTLGQNIGENVLIAGGLQPNDEVIVEGQQKVSSGMKVSR